MTVEDHFRACCFEQRPHVAHEQVRSAGAGGEERVMPDRHRAWRALRAASSARANSHCGDPAVGRDVRVQHQDQPVADRDGVIADAGGAGRLAEVREVRRGARRFVFVIARHGVPARSKLAPRRIEAVAEIARRCPESRRCRRRAAARLRASRPGARSARPRRGRTCRCRRRRSRPPCAPCRRHRQFRHRQFHRRQFHRRLLDPRATSTRLRAE